MLQVLDTIKMAEYDREDGLQRPDYVVLLEPTGIFRRKTDIDNAIKKIVDEGADSLVSVYENDVFYWEDDVDPINGRHIVKALNYDFTNRPRRQEKDWEWIENDALFITKTELLQREKCRLGDSIVLYEMPKFISCEIDTVWDLKIANWLIQQKEVLGELQK
jgi:N-acylneuraminate cytidylyltransferase